jgi:hypothetical protein
VTRLASLVRRAGDAVGADLMHYEITVTEAGAPPRTIVVVDEGPPDSPGMEEVHALLTLLGARA